MEILKRNFDKNYPYEIKDAWGGSIVLNEEDFHELTKGVFTDEERKIIKRLCLIKAEQYQHSIDNTPTKHKTTIHHLRKQKKIFEKIAEKA